MYKKDLSFQEKIRMETSNYTALDPEFIERERQYKDACDMRVALALGRKITDREIISSNI